MSSSAPREPVRRPVLAPGLRAFARAPRELQIGLTPHHRLRLRDTPSLRRVLGTLTRGEVPRDTPGSRRALAVLAPVLRDSDAFGQTGIAPADGAAAALRHPDDVADRLRLRGLQRVRIDGDLDLGPEIDLPGLLRRCGLGTAQQGDEPTVVVALVRGEPDRTRFDEWVRDGIPHLVVRAIESELVIGPFVVPEQTACLRCIDTYDDRQNDLPTGPALAEYLQWSRRDGIVEPLDSAVATIGTGWIASDLVRFAEGDRPTTWSATVTLGNGPGTVAREPWLRHPGCGCSWGAAPLQGPSVTMEA